jgi:hypothetical protein
LQKAGVHAGLYALGRVFRFAEKSVKGGISPAKIVAKSLSIPNLLTGYRDTAAPGNTSR